MPVKVVVKSRPKNYVIGYLGKARPVDGGKGPPENSAVTVGKALAVPLIGIEQGAVDVEEVERFAGCIHGIGYSNDVIWL